MFKQIDSNDDDDDDGDDGDDVVGESITEQISLEESPLRLVYKSGSQAGRVSTKKFVLTGADCCEKLMKRVTAVLSVEGVVQKKILEPEPNLEVVFTWNRTDIYGRRVHGAASSVLKVGFDFDDCERTVWETRVVIFEAEDPHLGDFAGWTLDLHHRFEPRSGMIYFGDGRKADLKSGGKSARSVQNLFEVASGKDQSWQIRVGYLRKTRFALEGAL